MKTNRLALSLICYVICAVTACAKPDPNQDQINMLPDVTQTGANTFGCLVNTQAFVPYVKSSDPTDAYSCHYFQYKNGDYEFFIEATNEQNTDNTIRISLGTYPLRLQEGKKYKLGIYSSGDQLLGLYDNIYRASPIDEYSANTIYDSELYISTLDETNHIIAGTFSFDAVNKTGDFVHVTNGRFDMTYDTQ